MKYLPMNTVMYDPPSNRGSKLAKVSSGESSSEMEDNAEVMYQTLEPVY